MVIPRSDAGFAATAEEGVGASDAGAGTRAPGAASAIRRGDARDPRPCTGAAFLRGGSVSSHSEGAASVARGKRAGARGGNPTVRRMRSRVAALRGGSMLAASEAAPGALLLLCFGSKGWRFSWKNVLQMDTSGSVPPSAF